MRSILSLENFGVAYGKKVVLDGVNLEIPEQGVFVLMGPVGTGKSTLLRTLAGYNSASPCLRTWGTVKYLGAPLTDQGPTLVMQKARLLISTVLENVIHELPQRNTLNHPDKIQWAQSILDQYGLSEYIKDLNEDVVNLPIYLQRLLAITRTLASHPPLLSIDEPTSDIEQHYAEIILKFIKRHAAERAIITVLHNQQHARYLGGYTALLAGGKIQACQNTEAFFAEPQSEIQKVFVQTGSCCVASPDAQADELDESIPAVVLSEQAKTYTSDAMGPRNFLWLLNGQLAGTPRPGLFLDLDDDLQALQRVGIKVLVSLTTLPVDGLAAAKFDITVHHLPIKDMGCPSVEDALSLCRKIAQWINHNEPVAVHCKAGLGRTGTLLACYLIYQGQSALDALESVRKINPLWIQSDEQLNFLKVFQEYQTETI